MNPPQTLACRLLRRACEWLSWPLLALSALPAAAQSVELSGTAFSVLYRGPASAAAAPAGVQRRLPYAQPGFAPAPPRVASLRLQLARNAQDIARADFDERLNGFMFTLPLAAASAPVCLRLVSAGGQPLPVRASGGDLYAFRNPLWERELVRVGEFQQLQAELAQLDRQLHTERAELQKLQAEQGVAAGAACTLGAAPPEPPRPLQALAPADVRPVAGGLCALRWEAVFAESRVDLARIFDDAGLAADWSQREAQRAGAPAWSGLRLSLTQGDFNLVRDAATKGRAFLEHAEGLRLVARVQQACRGRVAELASQALSAWDAERQANAEMPQRALQACQARAARIEQIQRGHTVAPAYRQELVRRIDQVRESTSSAQQRQRLDDQPCRDG